MINCPIRSLPPEARWLSAVLNPEQSRDPAGGNNGGVGCRSLSGSALRRLKGYGRGFRRPHPRNHPAASPRHAAVAIIVPG